MSQRMWHHIVEPEAMMSLPVDALWIPPISMTFTIEIRKMHRLSQSVTFHPFSLSCSSNQQTRVGWWAACSLEEMVFPQSVWVGGKFRNSEIPRITRSRVCTYSFKASIQRPSLFFLIWERLFSCPSLQLLGVLSVAQSYLARVEDASRTCPLILDYLWYIC